MSDFEISDCEEVLPPSPVARQTLESLVVDLLHIDSEGWMSIFQTSIDRLQEAKDLPASMNMKVKAATKLLKDCLKFQKSGSPPENQEVSTLLNWFLSSEDLEDIMSTTSFSATQYLQLCTLLRLSSEKYSEPLSEELSSSASTKRTSTSAMTATTIRGSAGAGSSRPLKRTLDLSDEPLE